MEQQRPLLEAGIFSIPEAAALVGADQDAMRVWVQGRKGKQAPVIDNEIGRIGRSVAISFTNLMELRFVAEFAKAGVRLQDIRKIMDEVRDILRHPHPFATKIVFRTDGRKILAEIARKNGAQALYDLKSRNYEMHPVVLKSLREDVIWDPKGEAAGWYPRRELAPNVIILPSHAFGKPILKDSRIPTQTIADAVKAEGSAAAVAMLYDIPEKRVMEAVAFENDLRRAA